MDGSGISRAKSIARSLGIRSDWPGTNRPFLVVLIVGLNQRSCFSVTPCLSAKPAGVVLVPLTEAER
jgi:hypothetical protein